MLDVKKTKLQKLNKTKFTLTRRLQNVYNYRHKTEMKQKCDSKKNKIKYADRKTIIGLGENIKYINLGTWAGEGILRKTQVSPMSKHVHDS